MLSAASDNDPDRRWAYRSAVTLAVAKLSFGKQIGVIAQKTVADIFSHPDAFLFPLLIGIAYYLITVGGILLGSVYEALDKTDRTKILRPREVLSYAFTSGSWQGIIASPLVFAIIKGAIPSEGVTFSMSILAFENGFFWRSTLKKFTQRNEPDKNA